MSSDFFSTTWTKFDDLLVKYGLEPSEIARLQEGISSEFTTFTGGERGSYPTLSESVENLDTFRQYSDAVGPGALYLANRMIQDRYRYVTTPAARIIGNLGSEYASLIGGAIQAAEEEKFKWGQRAVTAARIAGGIYSSRGAIGWAMKNGRRVIQTVGNVARGARGVRRGVQAGSAVAAAGSGGLAIGPAVLAVLGTVAFEYLMVQLQALAEYAASDYAYARARTYVAQGLFDKQRVSNEGSEFLGVLAGGSYAGDRGYDYQERVLGTVTYGAAPRDFGFSFLETAIADRQLAKSSPLQDDERAELTGSMLTMAQLIGVGEEQLVVPMASLSRVGGSNNSVARVAEQFTDFFSALSGDGTLITSQHGIVSSLIEFSRLYGYGQKMNEGAPEAVAGLASYLQGSELVRVQDPTALISTITSIDDILHAGSMQENPYARQLMNMAGISTAEGIHGLTRDPELLPRFLDALSVNVGISSASFNADGGITNEAATALSATLVRGLGMDPAGINNIIAALKEHHTGTPSTSIKDISPFLADRSDSLTRSKVVELHASIVKQDLVLSRLIMENASAMLDVHDATMSFVSSQIHVRAAVTMLAEKTLDLLGIAYVSPTTGQLTPYISGTGGGRDGGGGGGGGRGAAPSTTSGGTTIPVPSREHSLSIPPEMTFREASDGTLTDIPEFLKTGNLPSKVTLKLEEVLATQGHRAGKTLFTSVDDEVRAILALIPEHEQRAILAQTGFLEHLVIRSREFGLNPLGMLGFYRLETARTYRPDIVPLAWNEETGEWELVSSAIGLNQWLAAFYEGEGMTKEQVGNMTAVEQLDLSLFYMFTRGTPLEVGGTASQMYMLTAAPAFVSHIDDLDHIIYPAGSDGAEKNPSWLDSRGHATPGGILGAMRDHVSTLFIDVDVDYLDSYPEMAVTLMRNIEEGLLYEAPDGSLKWRIR